MHERGKAVEGGLIECQTCEKKIYVVKFFWVIFFFEFFFIESYSYILIISILYKSQLFCYIKKLPTLTELLGSVLTSVSNLSIHLSKSGFC